MLINGNRLVELDKADIELLKDLLTDYRRGIESGDITNGTDINENLSEIDSLMARIDY